MSNHRFGGPRDSDPDGVDPSAGFRSEPEGAAEAGGALALEVEGPRRKPRLRRVLIVVLASSLVIALLAVGGVWYLTNRYAGNVTRIPDVFASIPEIDRPAPPVVADGDDPPVSLLLVGSDSRAEELTTGEDATAEGGSERSDVLMLVQVAGDRQSAVVISIPRDSYVPVPGYGTTKVNAAFAYGGPSLLIQTVEQLTDIRIDHYMAVDFFGFEAITDAIGGVDVRIAEDTFAHGVQFQAGVNHLDGEQALAYVRQRYQLPGGDFDRVERHQNYVRAVMTKVGQENLLTDPGRLDDFLLAVTGSISVDEELSDLGLLNLALSLRSLPQQNVAFMTAPVAGTGYEGTASVVYLDDGKCQQLWSYINAGTLPEHLGEFEQLPKAPR